MPSVFERNPRKTLVVFVVLMALSIDLAGTAIVYWVAERLAQKSWPYRRSRVSHHELRPSLSRPRARYGPFRYSLFTNSLGFRDASTRQVPLVADHPRLLFMGDSFTEGLGVRYEESFVGRVDAALRPTGTEVLNAGVWSHSPIVYARELRHLLDEVHLRFDELAIFIDLSDVTDEMIYFVDPEGALRKDHDVEQKLQVYDAPGLYDFLHLHTTIVAFLAEAGRWFWRGEHGRLMADVIYRDRGIWTVDDAVYLKYGREGLARAAAHLDDLLAVARTHGIQKITVAVYPWPAQIYYRDLESKQVIYWRDYCARRGVHFLDLFPTFVGTGEPTSIIHRYFLRSDTHWNPEGHALVAERFLEDRRSAQ